jgi:hypothetical protein
MAVTSSQSRFHVRIQQHFRLYPTVKTSQNQHVKTPTNHWARLADLRILNLPTKEIRFRSLKRPNQLCRPAHSY